jgi:hypothetical protein
VTAPEQPPHDDDLFDESWQAPEKTNRLTVVLVVALLVVAGFAGGVLVQKHHDVGLAAAAVGAGRRAGGGGTGGTGGRGQGDQAAAGGATPADAPVVVGTVRTVDKDAIEVTDQSGAIVRVFVSPTTTVTTRGLAGLAYGTPVSVAGTKDVDGSVTATSVTVRAAGG